MFSVVFQTAHRRVPVSGWTVSPPDLMTSSPRYPGKFSGTTTREYSCIKLLHKELWKCFTLRVHKFDKNLEAISKFFAQKFTWIMFHTEDPQILVATAQNLVTREIWLSGFVYPSLSLSIGRDVCFAFVKVKRLLCELFEVRTAVTRILLLPLTWHCLFSHTCTDVLEQPQRIFVS